MHLYRNLMLSVLALGFFIVGPRADDRPACDALFSQDAELIKALPPRLQPIVASAHFHWLLTNRDVAWSNFHQALDQALVSEGKNFFGEIGDLRLKLRFHRSTPETGKLELMIGAADPTIAGSIAGGGFKFLDLVAAELDWIAKARAAGKIDRGLTIIGNDLENTRLIDTLTRLGFERSRTPGPKCSIYGIAGTFGGAIAGYTGGRIFFSNFDVGPDNGSIEEEQRKFHRDLVFGTSVGGLAAGGTVFALVCFRKTGRNYTLDFDPAGIPTKPAELPPPRPALPVTDEITPGD